MTREQKTGETDDSIKDSVFAIVDLPSSVTAFTRVSRALVSRDFPYSSLSSSSKGVSKKEIYRRASELGAHVEPSFRLQPILVPNGRDLSDNLVPLREPFRPLDTRMEAIQERVELELTRRVLPCPNSSYTLLPFEDHDFEPVIDCVSCRRDTGETCPDDRDATERFLSFSEWMIRLREFQRLSAKPPLRTDSR